MDISNVGLAFNKWVFNQLEAGEKKGYREDTNKLHSSLFMLDLGNKWKSLDMSVLDLGDVKRPYTSFDLTIAWPGMIMGLGYGHGAKTGADSNSHPHETEIKTGFFFDFTTGLPILPGSTVKGILRSFFPGRIKCKENDDDCIELKNFTLQRIKSTLKEITTRDWTDEQVIELEQAIFEGKMNGKSIPSTEQDIFLDAFPFKGAVAKVLNSNSPTVVPDAFLGEDVLTPHDHPLQNPIPIKHLKLLPGVEMKFQFLLNNIGGLSAGQKVKLFTFLIQNFGAGARKGTGFGQFEQHSGDNTTKFSGNGYIEFDDLYVGWDSESEPHIKSRNERIPEINTNQPSIVEDVSWPDLNSIKLGNLINGTVLSCISGNMTIRLHVKGANELIKLNGKENQSTVLSLKVTEVSGKQEKGNFKIEKVQISK